MKMTTGASFVARLKMAEINLLLSPYHFDVTVL